MSRWFGSLISNGIAVGAIRDDLPLALLVEATVAVFQVLDSWALRTLREEDGRIDLELGWALVSGLWTRSRAP
ncbi:MAG: hypothetical protein ACFB9M_19285 [Myxococcota bacterium]